MGQFTAPTPVLRMFDERKAREFYLDFLGFEIEFEHRFEPNAPLYMGLRMGDCVVHLSEHHGDGAPGAQLRIETDDLAQYQKKLAAKDCRFARPGAPEERPWGFVELTIVDPFSNRLTFCQNVADG